MRDGFVKVAAVTPEVRVADVAFNVKACVAAAREAAAQDGAAVIVLPELALTGYTCEDLFWQDALVRAADAGLADFAAATADLDALLLVGVPVRANAKLYNCAAAVSHGAILGVVLKTHIPNYNEFYEGRHFVPGPLDPVTVSVGGEKDVPAGRLGIGVDIGSTATKVAVVDESGELVRTELMPTGFSSVDAAERARATLETWKGDGPFSAFAARVVATGYGRVAVPYADKVVTEITCHGRGAAWLFGADGTVIDVGGQDTKVIRLRSGRVAKFVMNDKCAAGTGRFLEIMADRLGVSHDELSALARSGEPTQITSRCTVFAESEVISLVGRGEPRENIARGVIESVVGRVATLVGSAGGATPYYLTGGLCDNELVVELLGEKLGAHVGTCSEARYAGAIGAALVAQELE